MAGLIRAVEAAGGFAAVIRKGDRDAGTILVILAENGVNQRLFERMPSLEGGREWTQIASQRIEKPLEFEEYLVRRKDRDHDLWIVELDIADGERFIP